jgi:3-dehydroquinate dehydratase I
MILKPQTVAVLGRDAIEDVLVASDSDMIEVRLDLIATDPIDAIKAIRKATTKPIIATNRLKAEGGKFEGIERERCELLIQASMYSDYVDIELRADLRDELIRRVHKPVILSYHDFQGMPNLIEMRNILRNMKKAGAAIAKIAVTPAKLKDNLQILEFLLEADMPICVIAMGKLGRHLRAVAPLYGSILTYGYVFEATAPGQMSVKELKEAMRLLDPSIKIS